MTPDEVKALWPFSFPPREVQLEAIAAGFGKEGFCYFMRQRLGKTFTAFAEYSILRNQGEVKWFFVICPNSIKEQWEEQLELANPYIPICSYSSQNKANTKKYFTLNKRGGVFIINYESLRPFAEEFFTEPLFDPSEVYIVADESTKIKDPSGKAAKAAHALAALCKYARVLTGKPRANSNADLWSQLKFARATEFNFYQHKHLYCRMGGYMGRKIVKDTNTDHLKNSMAPFCYIAPDKYIKGFEKSYEPMRRVNLTSKLEADYKAMEDELVLTLNSDVKITAPIALSRYLRLQQISSGVAGDTDGNQHNLIDPFDNPRIRVVREILDSEVSNKCIIACRFVLSIYNLKRVLEHHGHKCAVLMGDEHMRKMGLNIVEEKWKFNNTDYDILLGQLQTLAYGHTLPGNKDNPCDSMIFYENDFSLLNRSQCESRPEDADNQRVISYYDLFASKMDKYMVSTLVKKEDAALKLMGYARRHGMRPELSKDH